MRPRFCCQYMGCSYETDWVNIILTVIPKKCIMNFISHITPLCTFKGQVHVFAGRVNIVCHSSCRPSAILNIFVP